MVLLQMKIRYSRSVFNINSPTYSLVPYLLYHNLSHMIVHSIAFFCIYIIIRTLVNFPKEYRIFAVRNFSGRQKKMSSYLMPKASDISPSRSITYYSPRCVLPPRRERRLLYSFLVSPGFIFGGWTACEPARLQTAKIISVLPTSICPPNRLDPKKGELIEWLETKERDT